jgi:CheY-like chemotaxis protein
VDKTKVVVLVVGRGHAWRLPLVTAIQRGGYVTLEANDGFEALLSATENHIDVLISGDEMVDLSGREVIGIIRRHNAIVRCLLISDSQGGGGLPENVEVLGAPFKAEELLCRIREMCPDSRTDSRAS